MREKQFVQDVFCRSEGWNLVPSGQAQWSRRFVVNNEALFQRQTKGSGTFFGLDVCLMANANRPKNEPDPTPVNRDRKSKCRAMLWK